MGRSLSFVCVVAAVLVGTAAPRHSQLTRYAFSAPHMGTEFRIIIYTDSDVRASAAADAAFARVAELDARLSDYRADSELTTLGDRAGGRPVRVSDDLFRVLSYAQRIARASGGAFDPTVGPLTTLWRRARRTSEVPGGAEIVAARDLVGYPHLVLNARARTVRLDKKGMRLDLGGIGKGFAADEAAGVLARHDIDRALVAAGGDIVVRGSPPDADGWTVAVAPIDSADHKGPPHVLEGPTYLTGGDARRLDLRNAAISTSGDREQWFEHGGVRYSHIIDPRTGWAVGGASSVTVVARRGADADALATAVAVLGPKKGMELIDAEDGAAAFMQRARDAAIQTFVSRRWNTMPY